jgi:ribonuclease D
MQTRYIDQQDQLIEAAETLTDSGWIALDTEFMRQSTYHANICLLQIGTAETIYLVDTLAGLDLGPLLDRVFDSPAMKLIHSAYQDLEIFAHAYGRMPKPLYDTQVAAQLAGIGEQLGYAQLVQNCIGIEVDKSHSRTDWSQRPLSTNQINYAAEDVRHLGVIYQLIEEKLAEQGRTGWLDEDFAEMVVQERYQEDPAEAWRRLKIRRPLKGASHALLCALAAWREQRAVQENKPRRWILADDVLIKLAITPPRATEQLLNAGVNERKTRRYGETLLEITSAILATATGDEAPPPKPNEQEQLLLAEAKELVAKEAEKLGLGSGSLATAKDLLGLLRGDDNSPLNRGWRKQVFGDRLHKLLQPPA